MLQIAAISLLLAIMMGFLAYTGIALAFASIAKFLFAIFFLGFLIIIFYSILSGKANPPSNENTPNNEKHD